MNSIYINYNSYLIFITLIVTLIIISSFLITIYSLKKQVTLQNEEKEKEEIYRSLMNSINEGFSIWDNNLNLNFLNKYIIEMLNKQNINIPEKYSNVFNFIPKLKKDYDFEHFIKNKYITEYKKDKYKIATNKDDIYISIKGFKFSKKIGLIITNISDAVYNEKRLKNLATKANEANIAKSEFLTNMSHELRTPLNGICGLSEILLASPLPKEEKQYIATIKECGFSLQQTVIDILKYSNIQSSHIGVERNSFSIRSLFNEIYSYIQPFMIKKQLIFDFVIDPRIPDKVIGDYSKLRQIFLNVVGNAVKFTPKGNVIMEALYIDGSNKLLLMFSVKDTGIGIPLDKQSRVFEKFYQVNNYSSSEFPGTGLGLSICKELVTLMHGKIGVQSDPGKGTTVWFSVGLEEDSESRKEKAVKNLKILIVDDNKVNIIVAENILNKMGHNVITSNNGKEAINTIKDNKFDLILMDIQMPIMNGLETTSAIRNGIAGNKKKSIPIIAMTANTLPEETNKYIHIGMNGIIPKPINALSVSNLLLELF